jgi:hypothetical protein
LTGVTRIGTAYPSTAPEFSSNLVRFVLFSLYFFVVFLESQFVFLPFLL